MKTLLVIYLVGVLVNVIGFATVMIEERKRINWKKVFKFDVIGLMVVSILSSWLLSLWVYFINKK